MPFGRRLLNVGGNSKLISIPAYYKGYKHLILDIDPECNPDILCDARNLKQMVPSQFDALYCSHNLEHFHAHEVSKVLSGFRHVLKDDGFVEIRVPDILAVMQKCVSAHLDLDEELYNSAAGPIMVRDVIYGLGKKIEASGVDYFAHRTGFSQKTLKNALLDAGFHYVVLHDSYPFELAMIGFINMPTAYHQELLGLAPTQQLYTNVVAL